MDIPTILLWIVGAITWGIVAKISNNKWMFLMLGFTLGVLLSISIFYIFGGK